MFKTYDTAIYGWIICDSMVDLFQNEKPAVIDDHQDTQQTIQ